MPYLIFVIAFLSSVIAAYWEGHKQGMESAIAHQTTIEKTLDAKFQEQQNAIVTTIQGIRVTQTTIVKRVEKTIQDNPVYIDCKHSPTVLRDINSALTNTSQPAVSSKLIGDSMPRTDAAK